MQSVSASHYPTRSPVPEETRADDWKPAEGGDYDKAAHGPITRVTNMFSVWSGVVSGEGWNPDELEYRSSEMHW